MKADIRIKNGRVIDPSRNIDAVEDILVAEGKIIPAVGNEAMEAVSVIDATGCIVTPGLIDFHTHIFSSGSDLCISPEASMFPSGVTAGVDPGSSGTANIELFLATMLTQQVRVKAFMHVCPTGLGTTQFHEEIKHGAWDKPKMARLLEKHKDTILGLKVRFSKELVGEHGEKVLRETLKLAEEFQVPVCVHTTNPATSTEALLALLRPGDIFCHVFHGKGSTICENGKIKPAVNEARKRGVIFDAANGSNHFAFDTAIPALEQGFFPDVISTDLTVKTLWKEPVASLPYILSKYIALGCDLNKIFEAATNTPAKLMGMTGKIGTLAPGAFGDVAIFKVEARPVSFADTFGKTVQGSAMLVPQMTISGGQIVYRTLSFI